MQRRLRREIVIETQEVLIVRRRAFIEASCSVCREQVAHVSEDDALQLTRVGPDYLRRSVEDGSVHSSRTPDGLIIICLDSLLNHK